MCGYHYKKNLYNQHNHLIILIKIIMKLLAEEDNIHIVLAHTLTHMISECEERRENDVYRLPKHQLTKFHSWKVPRIGLGDYLERIHRYVKCSPACYVIALIYIDPVSYTHLTLPTSDLV
eukprot:TRINITY_DN6933_c0_g1_i17.p1 TRINITY_DN6933_c0_g1~~TRINITY_DN6933_c0_g1_i17.p1  ORF type:complete len:120 (+),score=16.15 TRINITY_DN6933_c0_g1_i17:130-489(+)